MLLSPDTVVVGSTALLKILRSLETLLSQSLSIQYFCQQQWYGISEYFNLNSFYRHEECLTIKTQYKSFITI